MDILCLGDIALSDKTDIVWSLPAGINPGDTFRVLFNWELPLGYPLNPIPRTSGPRLLSDPDAVNVIKNWAPGFAAMANNHILDASDEGLAITIQSLQQAGFTTVGAGKTAQDIMRPLSWETKYGRLAIVNWVFPETHPDWMCVPGPNCWPGVETSKNIIRNLKDQSDWVLVFAHWSDELFPYPQPADRRIANELAEAGADIIVGHHPHVVRGFELIGDCQVFYSIGNFYFSDILDNNTGIIERQAPRNRESLGVLVKFQSGKIPDIQLLSFWQAKVGVIEDPLHRAVKRARSVSRSLHQFKEPDYTRWYSSKRTHFERWGYRLNFRLWHLGLSGIIKYIFK